jgi:hypothetical protein
VTLLLKLSQLIDWLNARVAKGAFWLVLVMTLISAANASYRFAFNDSSNGLLEIQWYLFAAIFLLCSPYTLQRNEHVRIDVLSGKLSPRGLAIIDIIGSLFFLLPMVILVLVLSIPWWPSPTGLRNTPPMPVVCSAGRLRRYCRSASPCSPCREFPSSSSVLPSCLAGLMTPTARTKALG